MHDFEVEREYEQVMKDEAEERAWALRFFDSWSIDADDNWFTPADATLQDDICAVAAFHSIAPLGNRR